MPSRSNVSLDEGKRTFHATDRFEQLTLAAVVAPKAGIALAMAHQAFALAAASVGTIMGHVVGDGRDESNFLRIAVVVVQR